MSIPFFTGFLALGSGTLITGADCANVPLPPFYVTAAPFIEQTATGYARQPITFDSLISGNSLTLGVPAFPHFTPQAPTTQFGLFDAGGNLYLWWQVAGLSQAGVPVAAADSFTLSFPALLSASFSEMKMFAASSAPAIVTTRVAAPAANAGMTVSGPAIAQIRLLVSNGVLFA
jgi:hypothetical protein